MQTQRRAYRGLLSLVTFVFSTCSLIFGAGIGVTPVESFRMPDGFRIEKVYEVPSESEGSWVCMTMDLKGRLITSDQYGKLYRVTPNKPGAPESDTKVEVLQTNVGMAQGLLHTKDGLYVDVNGDGPSGAGVYRLQDLDGDDQFEKIDHLVKLNAGGEHGPHAIVPGPDGRLYIREFRDIGRRIFSWAECPMPEDLWSIGLHLVGSC
jgi:hypothetical protein